MEDTKEVIRIRISMDRNNTIAKGKWTNRKRPSTNTTQKTWDRESWPPLRTGNELMSPGKICRTCSSSGNRRVALVANIAIGHEWEKDQEVLGQREHNIRGHLWHRYSKMANQVIMAEKLSKWWFQLNQ